MTRCAFRLLTVLAAVAAPIGAAHAAELSTVSSSGSMTITVYVPPIGPALRAQATGAVGLWTIDGQFDGMMVQLADGAPGSPTANPLTVYSRPGNLLAVSLQGSHWTSGSFVAPDSASGDDGLIRSTYTVPAAEKQQVVTFIGL